MSEPVAAADRTDADDVVDGAGTDEHASTGQAAVATAASGMVDGSNVLHEPTAELAARVDYAFHVPGVGALLVGWLVDPADRVTSVRLRGGEAESDDLKPTLSRSARPDVYEAYRGWGGIPAQARLGFTALARLAPPPFDAVPPLELLVTADGNEWALPLRPVIHEPERPLAVIRKLLSMVPARDAGVLDRHLGPALSALWPGARADDSVTLTLGTLPTQPTVSVLVPVYGRYDLIEYQLATFANDSGFRQAELIYVVDDPEIADDVASLCRSIQPLFRVPIKLMLCGSNHGFAGATNIGVRAATAPTLLLLNSDVIPDRPGWLEAMLAAHGSLPDDGVLGARLLFPDGSLQHDGMRFDQEPWLPGIWLNHHPGKGLPPPPVTSREPVVVDAVTGACLMVARDRFDEAGGLDEGYIIGDFEDSDLCLRLRELGHASYVAPWIQLYHLERQSQAHDGEVAVREALTIYNAWRHTRRWEAVLGRAGADVGRS